MTKRSYAEIKKELEAVLDWFESADIDLDEAIAKHDQAQRLIDELVAYLKQTSKKLIQKS